MDLTTNRMERLQLHSQRTLFALVSRNCRTRPPKAKNGEKLPIQRSSKASNVWRALIRHCLSLRRTKKSHFARDPICFAFWCITTARVGLPLLNPSLSSEIVCLFESKLRIQFPRLWCFGSRQSRNLSSHLCIVTGRY